MPSSGSGVSGDQRFDLQTKENSQELHDKLTNILERFEQTRQAIKDNVRMLEAVSDSTAAPDSLSRTGNNTIDSYSSYPSSSLNKRGRSMSSGRLSSMDMASGTGTSCGLRTISSVDSGVMLTLTSCSENGTQSRRRSLGSWHGTTSPMFFTNDPDHESEGKSFERHSSEDRLQEDLLEQGEDSYSDRDEDVNARLTPSQCCTGDEDVFNSPCLKRSDCTDNDDSESSEDNYQVVHRTHVECACLNEDEEEFDEDRFETQEHFIVFEPETDDNAYRAPSPTSDHSHLFSYISQSPANRSTITLQSQRMDDSDTRNGSNQRTLRESRRCIVLPPAEKGMKSSRPSTLNITSHLEFKDEWMERDHIAIPNPHTIDIKPPASTLQSSHQGSYSDSVDNPSDSAEERCTCNGADKFDNTDDRDRRSSIDSRLIFSPIPEESPSELTPGTPIKSRKAAADTIRLNTAAHSSGRAGFVPPLGTPHKYQLQTIAQVHHSTPVQSLAHITDTLQKEDHQNTKSKRYRHKRKKPSTQQLESTTDRRTFHSSLPSTASSSLDSHTPKSDVISMSSYRNAIDRHGIVLPQIPLEHVTCKVNTETTSSLSSPSYYESLHSSSSSSSCSDSEYDFQVSLQTSNNHKHTTTQHQQACQMPHSSVINHVCSNEVKKLKPPVLRKISRETGPKVTHKTSNQDSPKTWLFAKNSPKMGTSKHKAGKWTSDQASYSLLRYFRFPSPPRTTGEDNSDSSARGKDDDVVARVGRGIEKRVDNSEKTHQSQLTQTTDIGREKIHIGKVTAAISSDSSRSTCSCVTSSSTTDTASEIAYPDLKPKRTAPIRQQEMGTRLPSKLKNQRVAQSFQQQLANQQQHQHQRHPNLPHEPYHMYEQSFLPDSQQLRTPPQQLEVLTEPSAFGHLPTNINPDYFYSGNGNTTTEPSLNASHFRSYSLHAQEPLDKDKKKNRPSIFRRLFRKQKPNKQSAKHDPKLMLDLAGGEVRVNPQESVVTRVPLHPPPFPPRVSYYIVPTSDRRYPSPAYRGYSPEFANPAAAAAVYGSHLPTQSISHRPPPTVYLRPRMEERISDARYQNPSAIENVVNYTHRNPANGFRYEIDDDRALHPVYPYSVVSSGYPDYNYGNIPRHTTGSAPASKRIIRQDTPPKRLTRYPPTAAEAAAYYQRSNADRGHHYPPAFHSQPYIPSFTQRPRKLYHIL